MKVYVAEEAGFCFGVKRALEITNRLHEKGHEIQIYGQLIHNRGVLEDLKTRGIDCIESLDQLNPTKTLVIRTHGIPKEVETTLGKKGFKIEDATCPLVKKLQTVLERLNTLSLTTPIIIVGDKNHPEIIAAQSYCPYARVIHSEEEAHCIQNSQRIDVVAQTTLDADFFEKIISILEEKTGHLHVHHTLCGATKARQEAVKKLAPKVDGIIVVGGRDSSNTKKLYNLALKANKNTFHIEETSDLYGAHFKEKLAGFKSIGIAAGASTPAEEIEKVENFLLNFSSNIEKEMNHGRTQRNAEYKHEYEH